MSNKPKADSLGDRMKRYEAVTRFTLPRRSFTIVRVDGRAFHTFTKGLTRPYDMNFMDAMDVAAIRLCETVAGAKFGYVQSDEISILVTDFANIDTQPWLDNVVQKWTSITASIATSAFNYEIAKQYFAKLYDPGDVSLLPHHLMSGKTPIATFDARVFQVPDFVDVENYFVWRQKDAIRNSVTMLAQSKASHKELHGKKRAQQHDIIHASGDNWTKHPSNFKNGRVIRKNTAEDWGRILGQQPEPESYRVGNWRVDDKTPVFTKERGYLHGLVPLPWEGDVIVRKAAAE